MKTQNILKWTACAAIIALVLGLGFGVYAQSLDLDEQAPRISNEETPLNESQHAIPLVRPSLPSPIQLADPSSEPESMHRPSITPFQPIEEPGTVQPGRTPGVNLESLIGAFPYKNQKPEVFPHWRLVPERQSIELYAPREFISSQVFSLARFVGDIDRGSKKQDVADQGQIKGFVYSSGQIVTWANQEFDRLDRDEKSLIRDLVSLGVLKQTQDGQTKDRQTNDGFSWNPQFKDWPINAYSNAGVFRHERVHVLWLQYPRFSKYFKDQWASQTQGLNRQQKVMFALDAFKDVPYNRPPSYPWWITVYDQIGEENVINEFTAHSIEKLPEWRNRTLPLAM